VLQKKWNFETAGSLSMAMFHMPLRNVAKQSANVVAVCKVRVATTAEK